MYLTNEESLRNLAITVFGVVENEEVKKILKNFKWRDGEYDLTVDSGRKKYLKHVYLYNFPNVEKKYPNELVNKFTVHFENDYEMYKNVYIFRNKKDIMKKINSMINIDGDENNYAYSPTGFWFADQAKIIKTKDRVIVIQAHRLDC